MLDQFMVSKSIALGEKLRIQSDSVKVNKKIDDIELFENRFEYDMPKKYGRPTNCGHEGYLNKEGFSDHFPISLIIQEQ